MVCFFSRRSDLQVSGWRWQGISKAEFCKCRDDKLMPREYVSALCWRKIALQEREGCLCVCFCSSDIFLGRDLASRKRIWRVIDVSTGLLSGPLWMNKAAVRPEVSLIFFRRNWCVYPNLQKFSMLVLSRFYCKKLLNCLLTVFSTTPCELWSKVSHKTLQRMHICWRAHTHTHARTHAHCFRANSRPPHTQGKEVPD